MRDLITLRALFMEWAYGRADGKPDIAVEAKEFMDEANIDLDLTFSVVWSCIKQGWGKDLSGMGNPALSLTFEGIAEVQAMRARRSNPVARAVAARSGLLRYFYAEDQRGVNSAFTADFVRSDESLYEGDQFAVKEIDKAAAYLHDRRLITGTPTAQSEGPIRAKITPDGIDCVERFDADIPAYLNRFASTGTAITTTIGTFNNSGNAAIGSTGVTQQATGVEAAGLAEFARVLIAAFDGLGLEGDLKEQVRGALEEIQSEAGQESAPGRLKSAMGKFAGYIAKAGQPVLTAVFTAVATHLGLPQG